MKIKSVLVDYGSPIGTYTYNGKTGGIGGKPFPSESEAWTFEKAVKVMDWFMHLSYQEKIDFLERGSL